MFTLLKLHVFRIVFFVLASLAAQNSFAQIFIPFSYWQNLECVPSKYIYTFAVSGTYNLSVPYRCNRMTVHMWGAGGGGGFGTGGALGQNGGAGGYATSSTITVSQLSSIVVKVGQRGSGGSTFCASPGTGGIGAYAGGSAVLAASGTAGAGVGVGGLGAIGADGGTSGGVGGYGGGGGGSGSTSGYGGGGGGSTSIAVSGTETIIVGGGGGGGGRQGGGGQAGAAGPACSQNGSAANTGGGSPKGGGAGGGACNGVGVTFQNGVGVTPFSIGAPAAMPGANAAGGAGSIDTTVCNSGTDGYVYISFSRL